MLFVSHQMNAVQSLCSHCLLLVQGQLKTFGPTSAVISQYLSVLDDSGTWLNAPGSLAFANPYFHPTHLALIDAKGAALEREARADEEVGVLIEGVVKTLDPALVVGFAVFAANGPLLFWALQTDEPPASLAQTARGPQSIGGLAASSFAQ